MRLKENDISILHIRAVDEKLNRLSTRKSTAPRRRPIPEPTPFPREIPPR